MSESAPAIGRGGVNRGRIEYLFDGVFAIAMTLLVLELRVPEGIARQDGAALWAALMREWPTFFSYLLSWAVLGVLWWRHHHIFRALLRPTALTLVLHLLMMATAAFFPFAAALLGRYPGNPVTLPIYAGTIALYQWAALLCWLAAERGGGLDPALPPGVGKRTRRRLLRGAIAVTLIFGLGLAQSLGGR